MINIYKALLKSQTEFPKIEKNSVNPHYKNAYATLPNVLSCVLPVLQKNGILFTSKEIEQNNIQYMSLSLIHAETGETIVSNIRLLNCNDMQKLGSAYTYALRYGLLAMLGISPDLDDDGNSVSLPTNQDKKSDQPKDVELKHKKVETQELFYIKKESLTQDAVKKAEKILKSGSNAELNGLHAYLTSL